MIQKYKRVLVFIALCAIVGGAYGYYMYNKPVAGLEHQKSDYNLTPTELLQAFQLSEETANGNYLNKIIEVTGTISVIEAPNITLAAAGGFAQVICEMKAGTNIDNLSKGQQVTIKGRCSGYLMDVILVNCNITP